MTVPPSLLFVFGLGYSAQALAMRAIENGWHVGGTVRSAEKAETLQGRGIGAEVWAGATPLNIPPGAHWLICVPPDDDGCPVARAVKDQAPGAASITYLSTTGVYGDLGGGWAFEWSPLNPSSPRAKRRGLAEQQWLDLTGAAARIARLPGIYGPGRSPLDRVRAGTAKRIVKTGQVFSRIHVDDLASGLLALMKVPHQRGVFHFCDDQPAPPQDVTAHAAELLDIAPPVITPIEDAGLSPMAASFYAECKRVSNGRTKSALNWRPGFPTYQDGLASILRDQ